MRIIKAILVCTLPLQLLGQSSTIYTTLMQQAQVRASSHGSSAHAAVSDGNDAILSGKVPVEALHRGGYKVIGGISDDPELLRELIHKGIDGYITDRPDILISVLADEISKATTTSEKRRLEQFDVEGHRGGRGLRPESTLPSFENGLDLGVTTLEMDTGVTADNVSIIWHDEYFDPSMCRRTDGVPYDTEDRYWIRDKDVARLQNELICDKTPFATTQKNDLSLSPVSVAFAKAKQFPSAYSPITIAQMFEFVRFYASYYKSGPGRKGAQARARVSEAIRVRFDLETKLIPNFLPDDAGKLQRTMNHTAEPADFVYALCSAVVRNRMQGRSEIQSFDFRTLRLVEQLYAFLPTYYLTSNPRLFPFQVTALPDPMTSSQRGSRGLDVRGLTAKSVSSARNEDQQRLRIAEEAFTPTDSRFRTGR